MEMKDLYNEIIELDKLNVKGTYSTHMAKLVEELGEFANEVNKLSGLKRNKLNQSTEEITQRVAEEAADTMQNILVICGRAGITFEQIEAALKESNNAWRAGYLSDNGKGV